MTIQISVRAGKRGIFTYYSFLHTVFTRHMALLNASCLHMLVFLDGWLPLQNW